MHPVWRKSYGGEALLDITQGFRVQLCLRNSAPELSMSNPIEWTPEAAARLKEIPFFVRPAARKKIEKFAEAAGVTQITEAVYEQAKQKFG